VSVLEVEVAVLIVVIVAAIVAVVLTYRGVVRLVGNRERRWTGISRPSPVMR
jgi:hypothetical protein